MKVPALQSKFAPESASGGGNGQGSLSVPLIAAALCALLLAAALLLAMTLLSGPAAAGASAGFAAPFQTFSHILVFAVVGLAASCFGRPGVLMLPASFLLMLSIGALTDISMAHLAYARVGLFACVVLYAIAVSVAYSPGFLIAATVSASFAYYLGTQYMMQAPDVASLGYFVLGSLSGVGLTMACGLSLGMATLACATLRPLISKTPLVRLLGWR